MKTTGKVIILIFTFLAFAAITHAQSPREQLQQMVEQLQKAPNDNGLREKILKLSTTIKPPPTIPEEANRAFVKGNVFQKEAKDASGYELAIASYREALRIAPWWSDAYFNLAVALEAAGKFDEAIASIRSYMASVSAGSAETREAQNKIYALEAKGELAAKKAAITAQVERQRPSVEGQWSINGILEFQVVRTGEVFTLTAGKMYNQYGLWRATEVVIDQQHVRFTVEQPTCPQCKAGYDLSLSSSGKALTGTMWQLQGSPTNITETMVTRVH